MNKTARRWAFAGFLALTACSGTGTSTITGVAVTVTWDSTSLQLDQVRFSPVGTTQSFDIVAVPEAPRSLQSPETAVLIVPASFAASPFQFEVAGLNGGVPIVEVVSEVQLLASEIVDHTVDLAGCVPDTTRCWANQLVVCDSAGAINQAASTDCASLGCDDTGPVARCNDPVVELCEPTDSLTVSVQPDCTAGTTDVVMLTVSLTQQGCDNTLQSMQIARHSASNTVAAGLVNIRLFAEADATPGFSPGDMILDSAGTMDPQGVISFGGLDVPLLLQEGVPNTVYLVANSISPSYYAGELQSEAALGLADVGTSVAGAFPLTGGPHSLAGRLCVGGGEMAFDGGPGTQAVTSVEAHRASNNDTLDWFDDDDDAATWDPRNFDFLAGNGFQSDCSLSTGGEDDMGDPKEVKIKDRGAGGSEVAHIDTGIPLGLPNVLNCGLVLRSWASDSKCDTTTDCQDREKWSDFSEVWLNAYAGPLSVLGAINQCTPAGTACQVVDISSTSVAGPSVGADSCETGYVDLDVLGLYIAASASSLTQNLEIRLVPEEGNGLDDDANLELRCMAETYLRLFQP